MRNLSVSALGRPTAADVLPKKKEALAAIRGREDVQGVTDRPGAGLGAGPEGAVGGSARARRGRADPPTHNTSPATAIRSEASEAGRTCTR